MTLTLDTAGVADVDAIRALLSANALPIDDVAQHIHQFVLAKSEGATIGTVAIEYAGAAALLRSLCVAAAYRGQAVATRLLSAIQEKAAARGVHALYLLTTSSAAFFERQGFSRTERAKAPPSIRGTAQFCTLCPSTAICMRKELRSRSNDVPVST